MLINLLKGDMKLVGVRPLSKHYYDLYTDELKEKSHEGSLQEIFNQLTGFSNHDEVAQKFIETISG